MTRWLCVHLPFFRTERISRASPTTPAKPLALVELRGDGVLLAAVSAEATAAGARPGMTATAARSLLPSLVLLEQDATAEAADLEALAAALGRFTPRVCLDRPQAVLLEITGCGRLFGSEAELAAQAQAAVQRLGYSLQTGVADNATAAYALALSGAPELQRVPVAALRVEPADLLHLHALGVRELGELLALPHEGLPSRFSAALVRRLRQLRGEVPENFPAYQPPQIITERLDFEGPTDRHDALLFALRRVAVALEERLAALAGGALSLEVCLRAGEGAEVSFALSLTRPTQDSRALAALLLGRFEGVETGGHWFEGLEVRVPSWGPLKAPQRNLFGERDPAAEGTFPLLLDELSGRLGHGAVLLAELTHDPRPERSFVLRPFAGAAAGVAPPDVPRPAAVFEPHEVTVTCNDAGLPMHWHDGRRGSRLLAWPLERVHFGWWQGDAGQRDYFRVQDESGAQWWLMRRESGWFIVGAF